jgi:NhaP-type Na+/H+ or K+/H+ antiporter
MQVGADEKLANVIDGESLVNDGSALVIFLVLQQFVQGANLSGGQVRLWLRLLQPPCLHGSCHGRQTVGFHCN